MSLSSNPSRRQFLKSGFPLIVAASTLGRGRSVAANDRIQLACIGVGGQGTANLRSFLADERVQVVAISDVDRNHLKRGLELAKLTEKQGFENFEDILSQPGVDAIMNGTPDHWHAGIAVKAAQAGKDLFSEKPLGASIHEGRAICDAVEKHQRILQCGTWRRSGLKVRMACELVQNGYIGELKEIEVGVPGKFAIRGGFTGLEGPVEVPAHFNYERWLGSVSHKPYTPARCHFNFRWIDEYSPGYITDWGAHFVDVAQWGAGMDGTAPVEVHSRNVRRRVEGIYDAPEEYDIEYRYANGVRLRMFSTTDSQSYGTKFIGSEGWIFTEAETLKASDINILRTKLKDSDKRLYVSTHHHRNFIDAVLSRGQTAAPAPIAQGAAVICYMGAIAARLGRGLKFDPAAERFIDDEEANKHLSRPMRAGYEV